MKNIKILSFSIVVSCLCGILTSCNDKSYDNAVEYLCIETNKWPDRWGILETKTGRILYRDSISGYTGKIVDGCFFLQDQTGMYNLYNLKDLTVQLNKSGVTGYTNFNQQGLSIVSQWDGPLVIMDTKGNIKAELPESIVVAYPFSSDGMAAICNADGEWGYVDSDGHIVVEPQYGYVDAFSDGYAFVSFNRPPDYWPYPTGDMAVIDKTGKQICTFNASGFRPFSGGYALVEVNEEVRLLSTDGKMSEPLRMISNVRSASIRKGYIIYREGGYAGLIDKDGNEIISPSEYGSLKFIDDNLLEATLPSGNWNKAEYGVIDYSGKEVMSFERGKLTPLGDDRYIINETPSTSYLINSKRERLSEQFANNGEYNVGTIVRR